MSKKGIVVIKRIYNGYLGIANMFDNMSEADEYINRRRGMISDAIRKNKYPVVRDGLFQDRFYIVTEAFGKQTVDRDQINFILSHFKDGHFKRKQKSKDRRTKRLRTQEERDKLAAERLKWLTYINQNYDLHITEQAQRDPNFKNLQKAYGAFDEE